MRAEDLIKVLQSVDGDTDICFSIGDQNDNLYRENCAKAELANGDCLYYLEASAIKIMCEDWNDIWMNIILKQTNIPDMTSVAKEFDLIYKKQET